MQDAQQRAYFEPSRELSGIKGAPLSRFDPTRSRPWSRPGNVEWNMAQLSRGSIMNLQKRGDYFEKIDYDIIDPGVDAAYRFEYGLEMLVWAQVFLMAYPRRLEGRSPEGLGRFLGHQEVPRRARHGRHQCRRLARARVRADGGRVPADKLYPLDIDKVSRATTRSKRTVIKWWDTGAIPIQLLTDRSRHDTVWNGRMAACKRPACRRDQLEPGLLKRDAGASPRARRTRRTP